jgi:hypothetical protein
MRACMQACVHPGSAGNRFQMGGGVDLCSTKREAIVQSRKWVNDWNEHKNRNQSKKTKYAKILILSEHGFKRDFRPGRPDAFVNKMAQNVVQSFVDKINTEMLPC